MTDIPPLDEFNQNILRSDTHYLTQLATHEKTHFDELMAHFDRADAWHISDTNVRIRQRDLQQMKNSLHTIPYIPEPIYHKSELENIAQEKRYLVEELPFATGGMSAVFKGIDLKMNRLVAIKCLFDEEVQEDQYHTTEREAKVMARINHPNIAQIYNYLELPTTPYEKAQGIYGPVPTIIMEYIEPKTNLSLILKGDPLPLETTLKILSQVGGAVDFMDSRGILHRDLKPQNIFWDETQQRVRMIDFGLASTVRLEETFGTARFISPEQALDSRKTSVSSEVFSLASVAFYMLTQEYCFDGDNSIEIASKVISNNGFNDHTNIKTLERVLSNSGCDYREVVKVFDKAHQRNSKNRYKSATAFVASLQRALTPKSSHS